MLWPPEIVSVKAWCCSAVPFVYPFVCSFVRPFVRTYIVTTIYLMDNLNNFDKTDREYSLAPTNDLIRFLRSKVMVTAGHGESIHVNAAVSKSIL